MKNIYLPFIICLVTGISPGCRQNEKRTETGSNSLPDSVIMLTREQVNTLHMEFVKLQQVNIPEIVYADGYISVPPQNEAKISPMISGYVTAINYLEGQKVSKGMSVVKIQSGAVIDLQQEYLELMNKFKYQENEYNRQKLLNESNVNARKIFLQAESDFMITKANLDAMRKKLQLTGIHIVDLERGIIISELNIQSPISGYVTYLQVTLGQYVNPSEVLFEVTDPDHLHAELNVFEKDASRVKPGQPFDLRVNQIDKVMKGKLFMVNKKLDDVKRTLSVHGDFESVDGILPGMYAKAEIYVSEKPGRVLPVDAIYKGEKFSLIFELIKNNDRFLIKPVSVQTGREYGDFTEVIFPGDSALSGSGKQFAMHGLYYLASLIPGN